MKGVSSPQEKMAIRNAGHIYAHARFVAAFYDAVFRPPEAGLNKHVVQTDCPSTRPAGGDCIPVTDLLLCGHQPLRVGPPGWPYLSTQARPIAAASSGVSQDHSAPRARIAIQRVSPRTECSSTEYGPTIGDIKQNPQ
jgi:hypothetical protein